MGIILDLCSGTGSWSKPYVEAGYDVHYVDLLQNGKDIRLLEIPQRRVHGILAAPPCDHLCGSGARWWEGKGEPALLQSLSIVDACLRIVTMTQPVWWALENPVGRLIHYLGPPRMYFNPHDYGDPWTKKTCLWGKFIEPLKDPVQPRLFTKEGKKIQGSWLLQLGGKSAKTKMYRSVTPPGFARAFFRANR